MPTAPADGTELPASPNTEADVAEAIGAEPLSVELTLICANATCGNPIGFNYYEPAEPLELTQEFRQFDALSPWTAK